MAKKEDLAELRAGGVKSIAFDQEGKISHVEFFPKSPFEFADNLLSADPEAMPTDIPPPDESVPSVRIPKSLQNIMKNGSVS